MKSIMKMIMMRRLMMFFSENCKCSLFCFKTSNLLVAHHFFISLDEKEKEDDSEDECSRSHHQEDVNPFF